MEASDPRPPSPNLSLCTLLNLDSNAKPAPYHSLEYAIHWAPNILATNFQGIILCRCYWSAPRVNEVYVRLSSSAATPSPRCLLCSARLALQSSQSRGHNIHVCGSNPWASLWALNGESYLRLSLYVILMARINSSRSKRNLKRML